MERESIFHFVFGTTTPFDDRVFGAGKSVSVLVQYAANAGRSFVDPPVAVVVEGIAALIQPGSNRGILGPAIAAAKVGGHAKRSLGDSVAVLVV